MARLIVRYQGKDLANLVLEDGKSYTLGRGEDCAVVLPGEKGISRNHLKLYQRDGKWVAELLARFGHLLVDGRDTRTLELDGEMVFVATPFELRFIAQDTPVEVPEKSAVSAIIPVAQVQAPPPAEELQMEAPQPQGNSDATMAGSSPLTAFVRISSASGNEEVLKLEGHLWVAGRDPTCEIVLRESRASRRHFEMVRTPEGIFVTDLASANGTFLNDERLPANEAYQLASGDVLRVADTKLTLEIRNLSFGANLPALATEAVPPSMPASPASPYPGAMPAPIPYGGVAPVGGPDPHQGLVPSPYPVDMGQWQGVPEPPPPKSNKVKIAIMLLVPLIVYGLMNQDKADKTNKTPVKTESSSKSPTFEQMSKEQQQAIKDSYALAKNMYIQARYELCISELSKLHEMVPAYNDSRELETFCKNGAQLAKAQEERERLEREKAETEAAIMQVVTDCRRLSGPSDSLEQMRRCLAPAIERAPEHPAINQLLQIKQAQEDEKAHKQQTEEMIQKRRQAGQREFEKAQAIYKSGDLQRAMVEYEKFLNTNYPNLEQQREIARRDIAQARKDISQRVASYLTNCRENIEKNQYREAYAACSEALKRDPNNNEARQFQAKAITESRKELKSVYEDSVLEESMGNIDSAKEKWKQIINRSIPGDEYFKKAKRNLQKYEVTE